MMVQFTGGNCLCSLTYLTKFIALLILALPLSQAHATPKGRRAVTCSSNQTSYDFIIVGGGTAGLALGARLSQRLTTSCILILEAGPDGRDEPGIFIPGKKGSTFAGKFDWNLTTTPQVNAANRAVRMTRGKVLGGTSALNLMVWDRGAVADYDAWEQLGNEGWNWDSMMPAMLKVENFTKSADYGSVGVASGGLIQSLVNRIKPAHQAAFTPSMESLGLVFNNESLSGKPNGVSLQPSNIREEDYTRSYSVEYLTGAGTNLVLQLSAQVARVNFDGNKRTTGVTLADGTVIGATREVILSAGVFQSPALLELSGIGNSDIITAAGVTPLVSLPGVGENLQDHQRVQLNYILPNGSVGFDRLKFNTTFSTEQLALWNAKQPSMFDFTASGYAFMPWSSVSNETSASLLALAKANVNNDSSTVLQKQLELYADESIPQIEIIFSDGYTGVKGYPAATDPQFGIETFTLIGGIMHPFARGTVHISSSSVLTPPTIDPAYLSSPVDFAALVAIAKYLRQIATTSPMSSQWVTEYEPGPAVDSDASWEAYTRNVTSSIFHPVGTCAMLPEADGGVVSKDLKVYGVEGLRVVDASVMPLLISAHIQTAVYGIAEIAADKIVAEWEYLTLGKVR
ncbi:GMC oxidoreductase [Halenospora varia]|nr:GMC oxidoreductase [Halenospora varia]